ncbi:MAG TPA: ATP-binding cassette domain-containing protein [bacterium]|nr:ATP-binding cassette domain-containing protein [bacterium]
MLSTYIWLAWGPIEHILSQVRTIGKEYESYVRMREVLDTPDIYADGAETYHHTRGDIELRNVSFGYTETITILQELSLRFEGGKTIALVGHSGSGKSTIMKLLLRIYDPRNGSILYDGQDLRDLRIETVYRHIGYLPQEPAIFDGTIRENLAYATTEREFSDHELWQALADARLDERVKQFETGLNTEIGERGVKLSGGERQRLAIARIFLKNPDIILLDEPTSALDSISEKIIGDLLVDLSHGKTVIIIAHRLQTVMHADTICVMDHGKVIERGTHAKLLAANGTYAKLVDLQSGTLRE